MGIFRRLVHGDRRTSEDVAANSLGERLDFRPFNYHFVRTNFLAHAFPTAPMLRGRGLLPSLRSASEVRQLLEQYATGAIDVDSLTASVFGLASFPEFVETLHNLKKSSRGAATADVLRRLESLKWSAQWERMLDEGRVDGFVWDCLGDAGSRSATHSGLRHDGWDHRDPHAGTYAEAARVGFMSVAEPFGVQSSSFGWRKDRTARDALVGVAVIPSATAPNPLTVLSERHRRSVEARCERLARKLRERYGEREGRESLPYTYRADSFATSLMSAAKQGALLAAIGIDPSGCFVYGGSVGAVRRLEPHELPWIA